MDLEDTELSPESLIVWVSTFIHGYQLSHVQNGIKNICKLEYYKRINLSFTFNGLPRPHVEEIIKDTLQA